MVAVVSVKGSPGVTTLCLALAACWPDPAGALVVEADPAGGDVAMRFGLAQSPGLLSLAAAARGRTGGSATVGIPAGAAPGVEGSTGSGLAGGQDPGLVWRHAQTLPGGLPVVASPPDAGRARSALAVLAPRDAAGRLGAGPLRAAAEHPGAAVVVDCGRVDLDSPVMPVVRGAEAMVVLTRSGADDLAHLAARVPEIGSWSTRPVLLLAGRGHSISAVARELGVTPLGHVPDDPRGAAVLGGNRSVLRWHHSGPGRSRLGQTAREIATVLAQGATTPQPFDTSRSGVEGGPPPRQRPETAPRGAPRRRFGSQGRAS